MKSLSLPLTALLAFTLLLPAAALRGQNPVPNSPPSLAPRNPALQPAAASSAAGSRDARAGATPPAATVDNIPTANAVPGGAASPPPAAVSVSGDYVLSPSDTLEMSVFNEPTLTTQTRVATDGTVQFPLIGEVKLGGMPIRDARELIRKRYNADYLVEPQVYLNVISYAQRRFTVLGQVQKPGTYDFPGGEHLSLLEAIGVAGSFTRLANENTVMIKRGDHTIKVNAKKQTTGDNKPFDLSPGDVITVNESWF